MACLATLALVACEQLGCLFIQNGTSSTCAPFRVPRFEFPESVNCGDTLSAMTSDEYPAHFYHFELASDTGMSTVTLDTCSSAYDTWIHLYDENSLTLIQNQDEGGGECNGPQAYMEVADLANGKYIIRMDGYANEVGGYNLTVNCEDVSIRDYAYVATPKTYDDAELYCVNTYEEHLATILTKNDMIDAMTEINGGDAPWIGLRSVHKIGWFAYFDGESCPDETRYYGSCLGEEYWVNGKPACGEKGGTQCVSLYGSGKVNNDRQCDEIRPFLCGKPKIILREYAYSGEWGNWNEAYAYCQDKGGLASFVTQDDLANLQQTIVNIVPSAPYAWIGLAYSSADSDWRWLDNTECTSTDGKCTELWNAGEPNGDVLKFHPNTCACTLRGCLREDPCKYRDSVCVRGCLNRGCGLLVCIWGWWGINCACWPGRGNDCLRRGCLPNRYTCRKGCVDYGCKDWDCHTDNAFCAAAERSSQNADSVGLVADYHCTDDNSAPIICNDYPSVVNTNDVVPSNPSNHIVEVEYKPKVIDITRFVWGMGLLLVFFIFYKATGIKHKTVSGDAHQVEEGV